MKILLTGNLFHNYEEDIKDGLERCGHQVDMLFNNIHGPYQIRDPKTIPQWLSYGFLPYKLKINFFTDRSIENYNNQLRHLIKKNKYDSLLVVGGKTISEETISIFPGRKIFWFMDALPRYQYVLPTLKLYDDLFVFEPTDVEYVKEELGLYSTFLTLAFNPQRYYRNTVNTLYDFSFVGSCYPKRENFLKSIMSLSDSFCICGDFYRSKHSILRRRVNRLIISSQEANSIYNSTKINLNIHHPQSKEGMCIRTFEILGAGGFQLMERQRGALQYFEEDTHVVFYDTIDEFMDKCKYYLQNDAARNRIAENGYRSAVTFHTWEARLKELQKYLNH